MAGLRMSQKINISNSSQIKPAAWGPRKGMQLLEDQKFSTERRDPYGNYLGIDVRGISVSAINTMDGGSAVATSNIIINPVQIINLAPEVEVKLI